jgi:hypothetical protein
VGVIGSRRWSPRDEHAVAEEADVAVGVTGQLEHAPAVDLVALGERLGIVREADERRERAGLVTQFEGDGFG